MRYLSLVPRIEEYPWAAVEEGCAGASMQRTEDEAKADVLVTWSPWLGSHRHAVAERFKESGRRVIVIENGWLSPIGGVPMFQVQLGGWNRDGAFPPDDDLRFKSWAVRLLPWVTHSDGLCLIIGQRGHGYDSRTAAPGWHDRVDVSWPRDRIIRRPRNSPIPLATQLALASVCHVWTSNAASWAMVAGVPVVAHGRSLITHELASAPHHPFLARGDREPVFERLAWAQWSEAELRAGYPFARMLNWLERCA